MIVLQFISVENGSLILVGMKGKMTRCKVGSVHKRPACKLEASCMPESQLQEQLRSHVCQPDNIPLINNLKNEIILGFKKANLIWNNRIMTVELIPKSI